MIGKVITPDFLKNGRGRVLIVERDALQAYLLEAKLREAGWAVESVAGPGEAILFCRENNFDVAIINYRYPGKMNGFELAALLRERCESSSLMITATSYSELQRCASFSKTQDILFKPYRLMQCVPRLRRLIAGEPLLKEHNI